MTDGVPEKALMDAYVKVIGWEKINGPDGVEVNALRLERQAESLWEGQLGREKATEWLAPGYGFVRTISVAGWGQSMSELVSIKKPE